MGVEVKLVKVFAFFIPSEMKTVGLIMAVCHSRQNLWGPHKRGVNGNEGVLRAGIATMAPSPVIDRARQGHLLSLRFLFKLSLNLSPLLFTEVVTGRCLSQRRTSSCIISHL